MSVQDERLQLVNHWTKIKYPRLLRIAEKILKNLKANATYSVVGTQVREFHNVLGYKAKDSLAKGGVCSGTIYRTTEFINMPQSERTGTKNSGNAVHIEHTIPVKILYTVLLEKVQSSNIDVDEFVWLLIKFSLTTAMLRSEGHTYNENNPRGLVLPKHSHISNVFITNHEHYNRPFMRYTAQSSSPKIYNVLTNTQIDVNIFTMKDFSNDLVLLLNEISAPNWLMARAISE